MPDPTDLPPSDPDDVVRRRLAAARVDTPAPAEVVARLDRVLADLRAERTATADAPTPASLAPPAAPGRWTTPSDPAPTPVPSAGVDTTVARLLDRRRRRSWVARGLAAACAVVAIGGLAYILPRAGLSGGGADSASSADSGGSATTERRPALAPLPYIRPAHAAADIAQRVPRRLRASQDAADLSLTACLPRGDGGTGVAVSYGGRRATLVFGPAADGVQPVTVVACDGAHGGTQLRVVRLPAP